MPRWKALPEELDPEVKEFTSQLRRLVNRSGLSIAAVADRTGYSKTSWERYLNGRLLAPKGAVMALADVTGTNPTHLTTMWELAERAWSRSEMRHDMTMEAIRISQARAALAETGENPAVGHPGGPGGPGGSGAPGRPGGSGRSGGPGGPGASDRPGGTGRSGRPGGSGWSGAPVGPMGSGGPGGPAGPGAGPVGRPGGATLDFGRGRGADLGGPGGRAVPPPGGPAAPPRPPSQGPGRGGGRGRRKAIVFAVGVVGALAVVAAAVLLTDIGGDGGGKAVAESPKPSPSLSSSPVLPPGVKCGGDDCSGQDPETMGCGGEFATTVSSATVGTALIEVRHSPTCGAAWARITQAATGDEVRISAGGKAQNGVVEVAANAYTPMVAVPDAGSAKACATLMTGETGCTSTR
ncbi:helix-turn-helix domain-containing protein [Streptomyces lushanensis]|uniref:helix-turn-helix domain-containing protein n=1 Tax=Streptomyces lushanensis TaxID=1434255 RepID=UPI00082F4D03|nr:XRE family transcriptional regulator [Streptomyces lushanensis]